MATIFDPPEYKEYRNKRFELFIKHFALLLKCMLYIYAFVYMCQVFSCFFSLLVMFVYFLVSAMSDETIYFIDNKDLGPSWKRILMENCAEACRNTLVVFGAAGLFRLIKWFVLN